MSGLRPTSAASSLEDQGQLRFQPLTMDIGNRPPGAEGAMLSSCHPSADDRNVAVSDTE